MRLIDADKLVDMLYDSEYTTLCPLDEVCGVIDACPTAEFAPVQNGELRDAAERDWISVEDRLPEEHESIFAKAYGTKRWVDGMFRTISENVLACVAFEDGHKVTMTLRTHDGAWALSSVHRGHVTHWMPLPEPPKEVEE